MGIAARSNRRTSPGARQHYHPGARSRAVGVCASLCLAVLAPGCADKQSNPPAEKSSTASGTGSTPAKPAADPCQSATDKHGQAWFEDDYERALACARHADKPLFIDLWAPWCHTCISMQEYIFPDKGLAPLADRFVWLAIDTDKEKNAKLQERFPPAVWPTFYVVAPDDQSIQGRYLGAASVSQLRAFLVAGEQAALHAKTGEMAPDSPLIHVREGDQAVVQRDYERAATAYRKALELAPADWPRRPDILVALIGALSSKKDHTGCVQLAESSLDKTGDSASATDFSYRANRCAERVAKTDKARADALRDRLEARLSALIDDPQAALSLDDRSDAMANLRTVYTARDKKEQARAIAERQLALLDKAADDAPNPWTAMTYNWPRSEVYVYLGRGEELLPVLHKSAADLPNEYDPPYRLAWVYLNSGKPEEALKPAKKALSLIYGPRKGRAQALVAEIYKALGDTAKELEARKRVVEIYAALSPGQAKPSSLAAAKKTLAALEARLKDPKPDADKPE